MKSKTISNQKNNFHELVNKLFLKIEKKLNLYIDKIDFDYEIQDYMMSITFLNKSMIIINKQEFLKQIWLATKLNGYHFNYNAEQWICNRSNKNFWEIFQKSFSIQSNNNVTFYNI